MALKYHSGTPLTANDYNSNLDHFEDGKVDKDGLKVLSENDFTTLLKDKLDNIEAGANKYTKPNYEPISYIDGLQVALNNKQSLLSATNKLSMDFISDGNKIVKLDNDGNLPTFSGKNLTDVAKPKIEIELNNDITLNSTHLNNVIVVKDTGNLTTLTLPISNTCIGSQVIIVNETINHTKVLSQSSDKINTHDYYALMNVGDSITLTATSNRWIASIVGGVYNEVYQSI